MTVGPQWSGDFADGHLASVTRLPLPDARAWAFDGSTGAGVRVAVVDSGVDADHPRVGGVAGSVAVVLADGEASGHRVVEAPPEDPVGHGTACAAIIRSLAPDAEIWSVRVLGDNLKTRGATFLAGVRWAVAHGMQVLNLSLSSRSDLLFGPLHEICDEAYFADIPVVCAANNVAAPTYPAQFSSVLSVAARTGTGPWAIATNPHPPVEFGAPGIDLEVAWAGGGSIVATGNSFAAAHVSGLVTVLLAKHPWLTPFQVKSILQAVSDNAVGPT